MRLPSVPQLASLVSVCLLGWSCASPAPVDGGDGSSGETGFEPLDTGTEAETAGPDPDLPADELDGCERLDELLAALAAEPDPDARAALIDAFVDVIAYGERGFPIVADHKLAVVHRGEPGEALAVAGDFNGWDPTADPLSEAAPGFYYAILELEQAPAGLYKLVREQAEFFADPLARRFGFDEFGEYSQIAALPDRGHHERWPGFDEAVGELEPRALTVYLPPGDHVLDAGVGAELPVLYMHDGQNLFSPEALFGGWRVSETVEQAIVEGELAPLIVVGIANTAARFDEYTPVEDLIDGTQVGGRADEYAEFVVAGVLPFIESRYPAASEPEQVAVMGSSLGGLVSLYLGLEHHERFGHVASMSGTVDWGSFGAANPTILDAYAEGPPIGLRIYLDSGGDPGLGCPGGGSDNYCGNVAFADALRGWGWVDEQDLVYRWDPGAPHNEAAWADRLLPALLDWFPG